MELLKFVTVKWTLWMCMIPSVQQLLCFWDATKIFWTISAFFLFQLRMNVPFLTFDFQRRTPNRLKYFTGKRKERNCGEQWKQWNVSSNLQINLMTIIIGRGFKILFASLILGFTREIVNQWLVIWYIVRLLFCFYLFIFLLQLIIGANLRRFFGAQGVDRGRFWYK